MKNGGARILHAQWSCGIGPAPDESRETTRKGPTMTSDTTLTHVARMFAHDFGNRPVQIVDGDQPPTATGEAGSHWTESGKTQVFHPNAYQRAGGFSVYHPSTYATEVGEGWVRKFRGVRKVRVEGEVEGYSTAYEIVGSGYRSESGNTYHQALHHRYGRITTRRTPDGVTTIHRGEER